MLWRIWKQMKFDQQRVKMRNNCGQEYNGAWIDIRIWYWYDVVVVVGDWKLFTMI